MQHISTANSYTSPLAPGRTDSRISLSFKAFSFRRVVHKQVLGRFVDGLLHLLSAAVWV